VAGEKHLKLSFGGSYAAGSGLETEIWRCNMRLCLQRGASAPDDIGIFSSDWDVTPEFASYVDGGDTFTTTWKATHTSDTFEPMDYLRDQARTAVTDLVGAGGLSTHITLTDMALYPCDTTGNAISRNVATCTFGTPPTGGASGTMLPTEDSVAVSWQSHILGPLGRGRIFTPGIPTSALGTYGLLSSSWTGTLVNVAKNMLEALSFDSVGGFPWHVRPVVTGPTVKVGRPAYTVYGTIIETKVGQVVDAQRRRRNKLPEDYVTATPSY
jgi:hypothetical protein